MSQNTTAALYQSPNYLLGACIAMLYWITRIWMKVDRGEMNEDPIAFALKDKVSYGVLMAIIGFALAAKSL